MRFWSEQLMEKTDESLSYLDVSALGIIEADLKVKQCEKNVCVRSMSKLYMENDESDWYLYLMQQSQDLRCVIVNKNPKRTKKELYCGFFHRIKKCCRSIL